MAVIVGQTREEGFGLKPSRAYALSTDPDPNLSDFPNNLLRPLIDHLRTNALRIDGPFTLRSGEVSQWYLDARQTTFDGFGAWAVGEAVLSVLPPEIDAVGGMTLGADPIAVSTALVAGTRGRHLRSFSIRKQTKDHGVGGRLVGPVGIGDTVVILEDTTTTGGALVEAIEVAQANGLDVKAAISLVDRSGGTVAKRLTDIGIRYLSLVVPADLGV